MNQQEQYDIIDAIATAWRAIGQPDIIDFLFLIEYGSRLDGLLHQSTIIGIPVTYGVLHGSDVPITIISTNPDIDIFYLASKFESELRGIL